MARLVREKRGAGFMLHLMQVLQNNDLAQAGYGKIALSLK
jgi:hypothetical protein